MCLEHTVQVELRQGWRVVACRKSREGRILQNRQNVVMQATRGEELEPGPAAEEQRERKREKERVTKQLHGNKANLSIYNLLKQSHVNTHIKLSSIQGGKKDKSAILGDFCLVWLSASSQFLLPAFSSRVSTFSTRQSTIIWHTSSTTFTAPWSSLFSI